MFQAALLAFKNKKDNELVEQIENGVLNNNGSSSSYFTKSAPNLNNYENDDGGENLDNAGQQQPLHGWKLIRKTVVLNQPGASSPNQTYLQGRVSKLQKLTQNIEVEHKETKLKYEYQMNLPDYTQNALPTKFAIESQMKSHKEIVENARKGTNTQPPIALHWMLKKTKERLQDKLPGFDVCKTIKHHNTRDQLVVLRRRHHMHAKRIKRAKKCVTSYHTDSHVVEHLKRARRKKRKLRRERRKQKMLRDHVDGIDASKRKRLMRPIAIAREEPGSYNLPPERVNTAGALILPAMEAKLYHTFNSNDIAKDVHIRGTTPHLPSTSTRRQRTNNNNRRSGMRKSRPNTSNLENSKSMSMPIIRPSPQSPNEEVVDPRLTNNYDERPHKTISPFITRNEYKKMSSKASRKKKPRKMKKRRKKRNGKNKIRRSPSPNELMSMMNNGYESPQQQQGDGVQSLLQQFNILNMEEKKIYLALMKQEMLSDIEKQEDINNRGAVSKSDSIIV